MLLNPSLYLCKSASDLGDAILWVLTTFSSTPLRPKRTRKKQKKIIIQSISLTTADTKILTNNSYKT
jgi:hypothetical protein